MYSKEKAISELRSMVSDWIEEKGTRGIAALARGANVSENCIRRILNGNSMPVTENLQKIITFIKGGGTHKNLLNSLGESLQKHIKFELSYLKFDEIQDYVPMLEQEQFLPDIVHETIFERSSMIDGISLNEVKDMFGKYGDQALQNLINAKLVIVDDEKIFCIPELKNHSWSTGKYKQFLSEAIKNFYKTDTQFNYLFSVTEGVSIEGYNKVMDVVEAAHHNILAIVKENPGKVPLITGGFMDTMTFKNVFSKIEENEK